MYTYAFLHQPPALELPSGIAGSLQLVREGQLAALVEPTLTLETVQQNDDQLIQAVLRHDRIIRSLFEQTALLPLRFGTYFISQEKLREHLQTHAAEYLEKLSQVEGKAEYTLRLTPVEVPEPTISTELAGRHYFLAKKQWFQTQQEHLQQQRDEFEQLKASLTETYSHVLVGEPRDGVERIYFLCDRHDESLLLTALQRWQSHCPHWTLTLDEGLPPYHFV